MIKVKVKLILILLTVAEGLILAFRYLMTNLSAISMASMTTFTVSSFGVQYINKVKSDSIRVETKYDSTKSNLVTKTDTFYKKEIIYDTFRPEPIVLKSISYIHDTIDMYDTIKAISQPKLSGDTLKTFIHNTNPHVKIVIPYVYTIRNLHNTLNIKIGEKDIHDSLKK